MEKQLVTALVNLEEDRTLEIVHKMIKEGKGALDIIECCRSGLKIIGEKYHYGIYYLSDLIVASELFNLILHSLELNNLSSNCLDEIVDINKPKVIIGTIHGDIHDMGKNIIKFVLSSSGFQVYDLGVDVSPDKFVKAVEKNDARIIGVSVLLTFCFNEVKKLMELLIEAGLRDKVKVIVGGYPVTDAFIEYVKADYCGGDAFSSLDVFKKAFKELKNVSGS